MQESHPLRPEAAGGVHSGQDRSGQVRILRNRPECPTSDHREAVYATLASVERPHFFRHFFRLVCPYKNQDASLFRSRMKQRSVFLFRVAISEDSTPTATEEETQ